MGDYERAALERATAIGEAAGHLNGMFGRAVQVAASIALHAAALAYFEIVLKRCSREFRALRKTVDGMQGELGAGQSKVDRAQTAVNKVLAERTLKSAQAKRGAAEAARLNEQAQKIARSLSRIGL